MTLHALLSAYCTTFWHGVLLASSFWLCVLNLSLWYWRGKIRELGVLMKKVIEVYGDKITATDGEG
jgi:hypothetical protein